MDVASEGVLVDSLPSKTMASSFVLYFDQC